MKIRLRVVFVVLLLSLTMMVWANGSNETGITKDKGSAVITIWDFKYGDVQNVQPAMIKIDDLIMQQNPNIKINHVGQSNDNYYQLVRAAVQAGEGPDIIMFHGGVQAYEFDDYTIGLDKYIEPWRSEISEFSWGYCSAGGDKTKPVHLVPLTTQGFGIYYNKALFKKAGLDPEKAPTDIVSFMNACEKLKKAGIVPITAGLQGSPYSVDFLFRCLIANIYGPDVQDLGTGKQNFKGNAAFKRATEIMQELFAKGYVDPAGTSTPYFMDAANNFAAAKGAMFIGLLSDVCHWKVFCDALGNDNVGYFPTINFPEAKYKDQQVGQPAGIGYSVMKWSKHPDEAAKVIEGYARGEGNAIWMGMTGALSPNKNVDIKSLGYPLVGKILEKPFVLDFNTLLLNEDANGNFDRYCAQAFVSNEISLDKFIDSAQGMLDNKQNAK
ncbi:ABC-type sugar transport system, periplasmic component [Sphaerochaeta pleomorpha str. Grapes]|uniref:ABC-type sugar transport system, periplasmic component n=1 Tax=Sphaerochaeta pleomorpha (strain ATCC BAA-1885 / DSM 22778 / Grapes) TaxID=158190 RepID=G8QWY5_SPHPG|nr:extracellular solute-binding protein [Sphaerochaeta pleomorpha]AEV29489.1 ABC-type sugar transport system, periplasmic component [Sphaerochaeta pleomorpha str. Grapes]